MTATPTVFIVDDEPTVRDSLRWLLESLRLPVRAFASARDFLQAYDTDHPGCLVLDVRMPEISGLQLQQILRSRGVLLPVILVTGHGDVAMAVSAMKAGAFDFMEKPINDQRLLERVQEGLAADTRMRSDIARQTKNVKHLRSLTPRETDVMKHVVSGMANKRIAAALGISIKTVEVHRARVMHKLAVTSVAELTALCVYAGVGEGIPARRSRQAPIPNERRRCYQ